MRIHFSLLATILLLVLALPTQLYAAGKFTVIIDPGHGGKDTGAERRKGKQHEKTIALNVALSLGKLIKDNHPDVRVVYTRSTDKYLQLQDRTAKAKEEKGDLFISIHVNAVDKGPARGFETYVFGTEGTEGGIRRAEERLVEERENLDFNTGRQVNFDTDIDLETKILCQVQREKHNKQSWEVAKYVQSALISRLKKSSYAANVNNRGVKAKNLFVLCYSPMPAILVELGYISNPAEEKFITSAEGQSCMAQALYDGFSKYKKDWDKRQLTGNETEPAPTAKPEPAKPIQQPQPASTPAATGKVTYKIQFLTSDKLLKAGAPEFKGLSPVTYYKEGKIYKYTYGEAATSKELNQKLKEVQKKFPGSFIIKVDANGNRIK